MTLTELRYAIMLAQEKHFGKAAKACHVSQPTLSVAINKLESELGVALFERDRNDVRVTEIGKQIIAQAQRVLDEASQIRDLAQGGKSQLNTPLKVGAIYTLGPYLFPSLIPQLKKIAPDMPLLIQEDFTANLRVKLQRGELDAIFVSLPFSEPGVVTQGLYDEPFVVLMRKDHPLSKKDSIKTSELKAEEILLLGEGHCFRNQVIEACPNCYIEGAIQKTVEGTSLETLRHMVASGMGMTVLPSTATQIQYYKSILCTRPFAGKIPQRRIALAWRVSFTRPKAIGALIHALHASTMQGICLLPE
ncbi:hydrogen peroxide-inducible genes activator [Aquicella lusitana]|uniref:LysR family transcriptional regulator n=1 Tax=Aquicella lusitana TaxID=254246 RepID=A0A370G7Q6_9COXI|nr:hydrogen peroxide-inducible genes activator [Aquicella lusitana]RDI39831.1 LysR family transcriptional regulator [Aquicella lusitana]VVC73148.1 Hydrogen peroxide-inducible genes activator [Aquicella lusitana]